MLTSLQFYSIILIFTPVTLLPMVEAKKATSFYRFMLQSLTELKDLIVLLLLACQYYHKFMFNKIILYLEYESMLIYHNTEYIFFNL